MNLSAQPGFVSLAPSRKPSARRSITILLVAVFLGGATQAQNAPTGSNTKPAESIQARCGVSPGSQTTEAQALCIATLAGLAPGLEPWTVREDPFLVGGDRAEWHVVSILDPRPCAPGWREVLRIQKVGGVVLSKGPWQDFLDCQGGTPVPSLGQRFAQSQVVALVRIESGETERYLQPTYKARVIEPFKSSSKDEILYFSAGNYGGESFGLAEIYLLFLESTGKRVGAVCSNPDDSRFAQDAPLYSAICPDHPIVTRYRTQAAVATRTWGYVYFVPGDCLSLPEALNPQSSGCRGEPSLYYVGEDAFVAYLRGLASRKPANNSKALNP
ncbi:MAG: hypothetical protein AB2L07_01265 [Thermoanaerobaculaceae bacterium]